MTVIAVAVIVVVAAAAAGAAASAGEVVAGNYANCSGDGNGQILTAYI